MRDIPQRRQPNPTPTAPLPIVAIGIGENDFQKVDFRANKHPLSSSVLAGSDLTGPNNPNYPSIPSWAENTGLYYTFSATLRTIDSLVQAGELPPLDFLSLDIQGLELAALKGATSALGESRWVSCRKVSLRNICWPGCSPNS